VKIARRQYRSVEKGGSFHNFFNFQKLGPKAMNIPGAFKVTLAISVLSVGFSGWADGQEERLVLDPPLSQIFPLDPKPDGVRLKFPILLNERTILGPNVVLRFIYVDPNAGLHSRDGGNGEGQGGGGGDGGGLGHHHGGGPSQDGGNTGSAFSRDSSGGGDSTPSQDVSANKKGAGGEISTEVWTQADLFREALDSASDMGTTLVYSVPGKQKPQTTTIDPPDGMLLAEIGSHVQVLGLTDDSQAFEGGVRPGDEIRSFEGHLVVTSLSDFLKTYFAVKDEARNSGKSYSIEVWRPSESRLVAIQIAAPFSLRPAF
jgi:hypothetical protein